MPVVLNKKASLDEKISSKSNRENEESVSRKCKHNQLFVDSIEESELNGFLRVRSSIEASAIDFLDTLDKNSFVSSIASGCVSRN